MKMPSSMIAIADRRPPARASSRSRFLASFACLLGIAAGSASAQTVILNETFENRAGAAPVRVTAYTGTTPAGVTYTASAIYQSACNGWVARWNDAATAPAANTQITDCAGSQPSWAGALATAQALGILNLGGTTTPANLTAAKTNLGLTAYSSGGTYTTTDIEIQSSQVPLTAIPAGGSGRYVTFGVDAAAQNCFTTSPQFQFYLLSPANVETTVGGVLNVCTDTRGSTILVNDRTTDLQTVSSRIVRLIANSSILYTGGTTLAVRMRNTAGTGNGNDGGIDNLRILDVTPTLLKTATALTYVGQPKALTFTVRNSVNSGGVNSDDNLAKTGWSFTDTLPAGVVVATPNGLANTCGGTVTAAAGGGTISIANGNLPAGTAGAAASTCTITVNVVSNTVGTFTNGAGNVGTSVGLNLPPTPASMEWLRNQLTITKISNNGTASFGFTGNNGIAAQTIATTAAGAPGTSGAAQILTAASITANTTITESTLPTAWTLTATPTCTGLAAGQTPTFDPATRTLSLPFAGLALVSGGRNIQCTFTNDRVTQAFNLAKTWNNPGSGHTASATTTGAINNATLASTAPGPTSGAAVNVFAGESITLPAETFGGGATAAQYVATVACTGGTVLAAATPPQTITIANSATATTCTYSNRRRSSALSMSKTDGAGTYTPGGSATYTLQACNAAGADAADGAAISDTLPAGATLSGSWTCTGSGGATCSAGSGGAAGGTSIALSAATMPAGGCISVSVPVSFSANPANY